MVFPEPFDVRTDSGGDISLDRGYVRRDGAEMGTIVDWFNLCREVCTMYMDQIDTEKIGGVGKVVEINESKFGDNNNNNNNNNNATSTCRPKSTILHEIYGRLNVNLVCANATAILSRIAPPP